MPVKWPARLHGAVSRECSNPSKSVRGCAVTGTIFSALGGAQLFRPYQPESLTRIREKGVRTYWPDLFAPWGCAVIWPLRGRWTLRTYLEGGFTAFLFFFRPVVGPLGPCWDLTSQRASGCFGGGVSIQPPKERQRSSGPFSDQSELNDQKGWKGL